MAFTPSLIALVILAAIICVVNFLFIVMVYSKGRTRKLQNALLVSLGVADFSSGFFAIPLSVSCSVVQEQAFHTKCWLCITSFLFYRFMSVLSALHLVAVVYEKYLKIIHPFWFQDHEFKLLRSTHVVLFLWLTSLFIAATPLPWLLRGPPCDTQTDVLTEHYDNACLAFFGLLVVMMIYAFLRIFFVVRLHLHEIRSTIVATSTAIVATSTADNDLFRHQPTLSVPGVANGVMGSLRSSLVASPECQSKLMDMKCLTGINSMSSLNDSEHSQVSSRGTRRSYWMFKEARVLLRFGAMVFMFVFLWGIYFYLSWKDNHGRNIDPVFHEFYVVARFTGSLMNPFIMTINNKDFGGSWAIFPARFSKLVRWFRCCGRHRNVHRHIESRSRSNHPEVVITTL